jgi:amino acid adenylation domain-containing protein
MNTPKHILNLLRELEASGITIWEDAGRLHYQAPKGGLSKDLRARVTAVKTELIELIRQAHVSSALPLRPRASSSENLLPTSSAQKRLWFIEQLEGHGPAYVMRRAYSVRGSFNLDIFSRSIDEVVRRHEVLRTTFIDEEGEIFQHICAEQTVPIEEIDLRQITEQAQADALEDAFRIASETQFDLSTGPLLSITILRLADDSWVLLLLLHHIVCDGWSMGLLMSELTTIYSAFEADQPSPLPALHVQYADFALWQHEWLKSPRRNELLCYWLSALNGAPARLGLPTDYLRPCVRSYIGATYTFEVGPALTKRIDALARKEKATLFMTLLSAFAILLCRHTLEYDLVIGSAIANRNRAEIEPLIGLFVNMLALRIDLSDNPTFRELLQQVKAVTLRAYEHQDLPFETVVEELRPDRSLDNSPLYQVCFVLQNIPPELLHFTGTDVQRLPIVHHTTKDELTLTCYQHLDGLFCEFEYRNDLFDETTIAEMSRCYTELLEVIAQAADQPISKLSIARKSTFTPNQHYISSQVCCVHHTIEACARTTPNALAITGPYGDLSYNELNRRANQLARYLHSRGLGRGDLIGICMPRVPLMIVGMLGILKAGCAYIPLAANDPHRHLQYIVDDAKLTHIVTITNVDLSWLDADVSRVVLEMGCIALDTINDGDVPVSLDLLDSLAYVMYTSGSSGRPKGVMVDHRALAMFIASARELYGLSSHDRMLQFTSPCFDISVEEIYSCLSSGATLVLRSEEMAHSVAEFLQQCRAWEITIFDLPTAFWHQLVAERGHPYWVLPTCLRLVIIGGERVDSKLVSSWRDQVGNYPVLLNTYGPTEATVVATSHNLSAQPASAFKTKEVPIGKPLRHVLTYILDDELRPLPDTVPGELYIGGAGVACGYLHQPELTRDRFLPDPHNHEPGARLFRTGDRVRRLPDGTLQFLGRFDDQIKIRGYRVEPGEVEGVLISHPMVKQAAVSVRHSDAGASRLLAHVVLEGEANSASDTKSSTGNERVLHWQTLFQDSYGNSPKDVDPMFNIIGWNSSMTRDAIPSEEMQTWVDQTVRRIQALTPSSVLEIGCGTGLLLLRLAPNTVRYVGTDFSSIALRELSYTVQMKGFSQVKLLEQEADNFDNISKGSFDIVVINSVIQYFPNIHYLIRVLRGAVNAVRPGGKVFIGDVRNLQLLEAFHTAIELSRAASDVPISTLRSLVGRDVKDEGELLLDPLFFFVLTRHLPGIERVQVLLRRGLDRNEMTCFRYDVVLHCVGASTPSIALQTYDWDVDVHSYECLRQLLQDCRSEGLHIRDIVNARVAPALRALRGLKDDKTKQIVSDLIRTLQTADSSDEDPERLCSLGEELGFHTQPIVAISGRADRFDVLFSRTAGVITPASNNRSSVISMDALANNPLHGHQSSRWSKELRAHMQRNLPEYMQPMSYVFLDAFPLTSRGKLDRKALPVPSTERPVAEEAAPASNEVEACLVDIWKRLLELDRVGIHDNFFLLGGHSLLAMRLISQIQDTFGVSLGVRSLFENPTISSLATAIESVCAAASAPTDAPLCAVPRDGFLPSSSAQERFWFMHQLGGNQAAYNISSAVHWTGSLELSHLNAALTEIVRRHEILRTTLRQEGGRLVQYIAEPACVMAQVTDLRRLPATEREQQTRECIQKAVRAPFDLYEGPLMKVTVLRCGEHEHVFLLTMHHCVSDAWSVNIFMKELSALYSAFQRSQPSPLPRLPLQYGDFCAWQRALVSGGKFAQQRLYWEKKLADAPRRLEIPTDRPRPPVQRHHGASVPFLLAPDVHRALLDLSQREGVTLFMTLMAAFQILLFRYSGQEDIVVSTGSASRTNTQLETLIGCFINIVPLRTHLDGATSFLELLEQVRETTLQAFSNQDLPFEQMVQALGFPRDLSYQPIAQAMLILQNAPSKAIQLPGITSKALSIEGETAQLDLNVQLWETPEGLSGYFSYDTDLFDRETVLRLTSAFETLLSGVLIDPTTPINFLPILSREERQRLLIEWNETAVQFPVEACLHDLFEQQAYERPNAVAISHRNEHVTYQELDQRANALARQLRQKGVGPDVVVGLCMERSVELVLGMLGILKAGGAYLPLDPKYPTTRLRFMVNDIGVRLVVTQQHLHQRLADLHVETLYTDIDREYEEEPANATFSSHPKHLAYVIFTSGSTGEPKAIAIDHLGVVNNITDLNRRYRVRPEDKVLVLSSLSFDMCVYEVLGVLAGGGNLIMPEQSEVLEPAAWAHLIREYGVTVWNSAPALLRILVDYVESRPSLWPRSLRLALLGGDWIPLSLPNRLRAMTERTQIVCLGGATEVSIHSTLFEVDAVDPHWRSIPYGKPMANQLAFILDDRGQPVPVGVPGELHLGGVGLARGYHARPEQTKQKFVTANFPEAEGSRLYKTGDRARFLPDGNIELLGRMDFLVKLLGHRVELEEIAAALRRHPGIEQAVAVVTGTPMDTSSQRLIAYFVANGESTIDVSELRPFLSEILPSHMVPSSFYPLSTFPLSLNGKVDRLKLATCAPEQPEASRTQSPTSPLEAVVASLWEEVLGLSVMGIHENFFSIGGHSLTATLIVSRLQALLPLVIPLRTIFEAPTVHDLCQVLDAHARSLGVDLEAVAEVILEVQTLTESEVDEQLQY